MMRTRGYALLRGFGILKEFIPFIFLFSFFLFSFFLFSRHVLVCIFGDFPAHVWDDSRHMFWAHFGRICGTKRHKTAQTACRHYAAPSALK